MKTLIKNGRVVTVDGSDKAIIDVDVVINNNIIEYIGDDYTGDCDKVIDASGKIVMPGLINCHTHLGMSLFRATNDDYSLDKWLNEFIWPIEDKLNDEDIYYTTLLSLIEMVKTGTTCFNDMYFGWRGSFKAFDKIKLRGIYGRCLMGNMNNEGIDRINDFKELVRSNKNDLVKLSVAPHALYTTDLEYLRECNKLSVEYDMPVHIHLSENKNEVFDVRNKYNKLPVEVISKAGFLDRRLILAHGTFISDEEINLLKGRNVSICTNPISNLNLGCGIADIRKYIDNGINVCLGTDGVGSGNNMNLFYHMSFLDNLQKGKYEDATIMGSYEVIKMATINGAKALGIDDLVGSIEVGKQADIIIIDTSDVVMTPCVNPIIWLAHNGWYGSVDTTIVNGEILMENKKLNLDIDIEDVKNKVISIREKFMK